MFVLIIVISLTRSQWCRWGSFLEAEAVLTRPRRGKAEAEAGGWRPRQNVWGRGKAVRKKPTPKWLSYRPMRHLCGKNWQLKIMLVFFIRSYCSCFMHVNAKQSIDMQVVFLTFIKFFYLIFYALTRPRRGRGNNHEARQDRAKAVKHRGEAEAASFLPRGCLEARLLPRDTHHC